MAVTQGQNHLLSISLSKCGVVYQVSVKVHGHANKRIPLCQDVTFLELIQNYLVMGNNKAGFTTKRKASGGIPGQVSSDNSISESS